MARPEDDSGDGLSNGNAGGHQYANRFHLSPPFLHATRPPPQEDTDAAGIYLFNDYLVDQITREHVSQSLDDLSIEIPVSGRLMHVPSPAVEPRRSMQYSGGDVGATVQAESVQDFSVPSTSQGLPAENYKLGRQLRQWADEFENSSQGKQVLEAADQVELETLTIEGLQEFLSGVFHDGQFSRSTIVAVFVFCSALVIKAIKNYALAIAKNIIKICFNYIRENVCRQVQQLGGWDRVFGGVLGNLAKGTLSAVIMAVAATVVFYLWKR